jgi:hypothetical protein
MGKTIPSSPLIVARSDRNEASSVSIVAEPNGSAITACSCASANWNRAEKARVAELVGSGAVYLCLLAQLAYGSGKKWIGPPMERQTTALRLV